MPVELRRADRGDQIAAPVEVGEAGVGAQQGGRQVITQDQGDGAAAVACSAGGVLVQAAAELAHSQRGNPGPAWHLSQPGSKGGQGFGQFPQGFGIAGSLVGVGVVAG